MIRQGSAPNFCPPVEEGITITLTDEMGDETCLEFLGLILYRSRRYGFFFPVDEDNPPCSSGEVVILEAVEFDENDEPCGFELVCDEEIADEVYSEFRKATRGLYEFAD